MIDKRALITGITGQDGAYLARFLLNKRYTVFGLHRRSSSPNFWRLSALGIGSQIKLVPGDVTDSASLIQAIKVSKPHELYNLAAQSFVGASFDSPLATGDVDGLTPTRILEILRSISPETKYYQASSSEVYGNSFDGTTALDETSPMRPESPYAAAKLQSQAITRIYREAYGLFAVNGILFNHESPLRGLEFVTRKISNGVARIKLNLADHLILGNQDARRDWGYAPDYVEAMWQILQQAEPDDFVIATGEAHSVLDFAKRAFSVVGLDPDKYLEVDKSLFRPLDVQHLVGNATKAQGHFGWRPRVHFDKLVELMVEADVDRWSRYIRGEVFAWDAPNTI